MGNASDKATLAYLSRNADFKVALDADQAEFRAVMMGTAPIDEGLRDDRWTGELVAEISGARPQWVEQQDATEELSGDIAEEIDRRVLLLGDYYPFERIGNGIRHKQSATAVYEFCLATTVAPNLTTGSLAGLPVAFEMLARDALSLYVGGARGVRTGWPRHRADGLPNRAKQVFARLHAETGECVWQPQHGRPDDPAPMHVKDLGLDVLVWRAMPDGRIGQLFLLAQCACGPSGWTEKWRDLDLVELGAWLRPFTFTAPVRCFCVPFHIGNTATLESVSSKAGLTLDRVRITLIAEANPAVVAKRPMRRYREWVGIVTDAMLAPSLPRRSQKRRTRS